MKQVLSARTVREFDHLCLTSVKPFTPQAIVRLPPTTVSQWERGEKTPSGPSLKLLALADAKGLTAIA
jgi:putative transcriptional regulator